MKCGSEERIATRWAANSDAVDEAQKVLDEAADRGLGLSPQEEDYLNRRFSLDQAPGAEDPVSRLRSFDAAAAKEEKVKLAALSASDVTATELAGEEITARLVEAPGNGEPIGGLKVTTESAWFAARPSGTEDVYKIYAESFKGADHLAVVQEEAKKVVAAALGG